MPAAAESVRRLPQRVATKIPDHVMSSLDQFGFQISGDCCDRLWGRLRALVDEHCAIIDRVIDQKRRAGDETPELYAKYTEYGKDLFHMALGNFRETIWSHATLLPDQPITCMIAETYFPQFRDLLEAAKVAIVVDWREKEPKSKAAQIRRKGHDLPYGLDVLFGFGI